MSLVTDMCQLYSNCVNQLSQTSQSIPTRINSCFCEMIFIERKEPRYWCVDLLVCGLRVDISYILNRLFIKSEIAVKRLSIAEALFKLSRSS